MSFEMKFENNLPKYQKEWKERKRKITYAWGLKWQSICTKIITKNIYSKNPPYDLTGRLRASLTFITKDKVGAPTSRVSDSKGSDFLSGSSGNDNDLIVGSNVEYAANIEVNGKNGSFIKPAIMDYREDYKKLAKQLMNED